MRRGEERGQVLRILTRLPAIKYWLGWSVLACTYDRCWWPFFLTTLHQHPYSQTVPGAHHKRFWNWFVISETNRKTIEKPFVISETNRKTIEKNIIFTWECLCGRWESNPWSLPRVQPPLPLHLSMCLNAILILIVSYKTECKLLVWGPERFQMKKWSTTKCHNFLKSKTFILVVSPSEVVRKNSNLKFENIQT
jgi:hypothetical protein